jgi:Ca2+-binding EF-hand superfamily protein
MTPRSLFALAVLPVAVAAYAQSQPTTPIEQPVAAMDRFLIETAFSKADINGDGKLSREEVAARLPAIAAKFDALDKDKDGTLSLEEFAAGFIAPD